MSSLDNAKLKELMKIEPESMSKEEYESFVSEFKNAQLLLPVEIYSKTQSDEINEPLSFKPVTIEENGCKCIPLFTDNEELKKDISKSVTTDVIREMDFLFQAKERQEEEHFRKLDSLIRQQQATRRESVKNSPVLRFKKRFT